MLRLVLLAACTPNVVAFKTRFDKRADDSTGPTSRSLMFATAPQKMTYDDCGGGELLVSRVLPREKRFFRADFSVT